MTFMAWKTFSPKPFLSLYNHMLIGTVSELNLNKADNKGHVPLVMFHRAVELKTEPVRTVSFGERRAVLGCFLISSNIESMLGKGESFRWTPWMENLSAFDKMKECPGEELLVALLETVKNQISNTCHDNHVVQVYLLNAELSIQELSFGFATQDFSEIDGLKALGSGVQAAKSLLDVWLRLPPENYLGASIISFFQLNRALMDLLKLSTLEHLEWAKGHVQSIADIRQYIDAAVSNFQAAAKPSSDIPEENMFEQTAKLFISLKRKWEPLLVEPWHASQTTTPCSSIRSRLQRRLMDVGRVRKRLDGGIPGIALGTQNGLGRGDRSFIRR
ncbi:hypothetical protein N7470_000189 [Penicillium chermesinum]|nr:hypothetical protein N7470_000189 [Penicillium chermesinum]